MKPPPPSPARLSATGSARLPSRASPPSRPSSGAAASRWRRSSRKRRARSQGANLLDSALFGGDGVPALLGELHGLLDEGGGDAVAGVVGVGAAGEDGGDDGPFFVYGRTSGVTGADKAFEARHGALHGTPVVSVVRDHTRRVGHAPGPDVEWPVLGETQDGYGLVVP